MNRKGGAAEKAQLAAAQAEAAQAAALVERLEQETRARAFRGEI